MHAVATDSIGRIYVADRENDRIQVFNETTRSVWYHPNISPVASWPGFEFPNDIYATGYEVWVADNQEPQLIKLDWNGNPQFAFDIGGEGEGRFRVIHQFSVDGGAERLRQRHHAGPYAEARAAGGGELHRTDGASRPGAPVGLCPSAWPG